MNFHLELQTGDQEKASFLKTITMLNEQSKKVD